MEHAILSSSAAERWLKCTPCARLEEAYEDTTSIFASEGLLAHSLAELELKKYLGRVDTSEYLVTLEKIKADDQYTDDMENYIEEYISIIVEQYAAAQKISKDAEIKLETKVDFSEYAPEGFGTSDVIIICDDYIQVIDLKYGKRIPISAYDNPQIRLYALGSYKEHGVLWDAPNVKMMICQIRLNHISTDDMTIEELLSWGESIKPIAQMAYEGKGELCAGDHCYYCKHKINCAEQKRIFKSVAEKAKKGVMPYEMQPEELSQLLSMSDLVTKYAKAINDWALKQAVNEELNIPGFKLVAGRSMRKYTDIGQVMQALVDKGYSPVEVFKEPEPLPVGEMEKKLTTPIFNELLGDLVIKPDGAPTLVPVSDKRPVWAKTQTAEEAFADVNI